MKFAAILAEKANYPVKLMCRCLEVSRSGFYAWQRRPKSERACRDEVILVSIKASHQRSKGRYGSPRIHKDLVEEGVAVGRGRVERLMRGAGLRGRRPRSFVRTTVSDPGLAVVPNVLNRNFHADQPNQVWAGDITYIPTLDGWLYLAVLLDLYSRKVVGWSISSRIDTKLVSDALEMALLRRNPAAELLHHSDRGCQYAAFEYRQALAERGIRCSMSRLANCWDNAVVESFFATLKTELLYDQPLAGRDDTRTRLVEYIEVFYNRRRRHSAIGLVSPEAYEDRMQGAA